MHILFFTKVLIILRYSTKHDNFCLGVQFPFKDTCTVRNPINMGNSFLCVCAIRWSYDKSKINIEKGIVLDKFILLLVRSVNCRIFKYPKSLHHILKPSYLQNYNVQCNIWNIFRKNKLGQLFWYQTRPLLLQFCMLTEAKWCSRIAHNTIHYLRTDWT